MAVRFFKKKGDSPVPLSSGGSVKFTTVDGGLTSYFATDKPGLADEFERAMSEGRSALSEISEAEFHESYVSKKNRGQTSKPVWREELHQGKLRPSESQLTQRLQAAQAVVGVVNPPPPIYVPPVPAALIQPSATIPVATEPPVKEEYVPVVGKRKRSNAKS